MTEAEFEKNCCDLWGEIEEAIAVFYTSEQIKELARTNEGILNAIQANALLTSWVKVRNPRYSQW